SIRTFRLPSSASASPRSAPPRASGFTSTGATSGPPKRARWCCPVRAPIASLWSTRRGACSTEACSPSAERFDGSGFSRKGALVLSLNFIRDNREAVEKAVAAKNVNLDVELLIQLDLSVRGAKTAIEKLRQERKRLSDSFRSASPSEQASLRERVRLIAEQIQLEESRASDEASQLEALLLRVPNIPWEGAPIGPD